MNEATQERLARWIALAVITIGVLVTVRGLERLNTWYLASDQYAFLTMAEDLREGRVTRSDVLYDFMPRWHPGPFDALAQTYHLKQGVLHSRYPPGFPLLLAGASLAFGESGAHWLNPLLYVVVFLLLPALTYVSLRDVDRPAAIGAAAAVVWLLLLLPTDVHLWGITVARDLPAHLFGLLALLAAVHGRFGWAGFVLGLACVVRPDSVLYVFSLGAIALVRGGVLAAAGWGALGFLVGAAPLFAYNQAVLGSPFSFTQGSEFTYFLASLPDLVAVAHASTSVVPAGGGFRVAHFARTMPGNLELLRSSFGWFGLAAIVSAVWGLVRARIFVAVFVPYILVATPFYGFWGHPDPRYLAGVSLCLMPLVAAGLVVVVRSVLLGRGAFLGSMVPAIGLMVWALLEVSQGTGWRDPYQREQIRRAESVIEETVPPGSIVITTPALGRPAENISHYTDVRAVYSTELRMMPIAASRPATYHLLAGRRVFYLLPPEQDAVLGSLGPYLETRVARRVPASEALDWFLNPRRARTGAVLHEVELGAAFDEVRAAIASGRESAGPPAVAD